jgi:hypothetical protein
MLLQMGLGPMIRLAKVSFTAPSGCCWIPCSPRARRIEVSNTYDVFSAGFVYTVRSAALGTADQCHLLRAGGGKPA